MGKHTTTITVEFEFPLFEFELLPLLSVKFDGNDCRAVSVSVMVVVAE